jgi:ribosomal protein S18 acetylase RimI-like enzyme
LKYKIKNFDESIDIDELAQFILKERNESGTLEKDENLITIKKELESTRNSYKFVIFYAYSKNELVGLLLLSVNFPKFGLIWDWQPVVLPGSKKDEIANEIIVKCIEYAKKGDIERLEVCFSFEKEGDIERFSKFAKWYEVLGFYKVMEEATLNLSLEESKIEKPTIPENIRVKMVSELQINDLVNTAYITYSNSEDVMFLDLTEEQKKNSPKDWFDLSKPIIEDASIVLTDKEKVVGFSVVKPKASEVQINHFGIHPNYRNKGLGKALLNLILNKAVEKGFKLATLDVAVENEPAYNLYLKLGFKKEFSTTILALNIKNE